MNFEAKHLHVSRLTRKTTYVTIKQLNFNVTAKQLNFIVTTKPLNFNAFPTGSHH